ncbi:MAG: thrombospondin type 3 repeat-containing protein [Planctomycetota bacterium]|jgi:hypothetical protein
MKPSKTTLTVAVALIFNLGVRAYGDTIVPGGVIDVDTTWGIEGSPFVLDGIILVAPGTTLTIDPGVEVRFQENTLAVGGRFVANGTDSDRISFVGDLPIEGHIQFTTEATNDSVLRYCSLDTVNLRSLHFFPLVEHCSFLENAAINKEGDVAPVDVTIRDCTMTDSDNLLFAHVDTFLFERNVVERELAVRHAVNLQIRNNRITVGTENEPLMLLSAPGSTTGVITCNTIIGRDVRIEGFAGEVSHNAFSVEDIYLDWTSGTWFLNDFELDVSTGNSYKLSIHNPISPMTIVDNNFIAVGDMSPDDGLLLVNSGLGQVINAEMNWWGTDDEASIEDLIYHFPDGGSAAFVDYVPFRLEPIPFCTGDKDCPDDLVFCNGFESCLGSVCVSSGDPCAPGTFCNETAQRCDECRTDSDCDNEKFCDGIERCEQGSCVMGDAPHCDDGIPCTFDTCDAVHDTCVHVPDHQLCRDKDVCNGEEMCHPVEGCVLGEPVDCDDGQFCNGMESCDSEEGCQPGVDPCVGLLCDEDLDECTDCLSDPDEDGICDDNDNCPYEANVKQTDTDGDLVGNVCDNCPQLPNNDQADRDFDSVGDICDNCPDIPNFFQDDTDEDETGDECDLCPGFDDTLDDDDDGVPNGCDICPGGDDTIDTDGDGVPDFCDDCPLDNPDDTDSDSVCDSDDKCPGFDDKADSDSDGVPDDCDNCKETPNADQADFDGDGQGDLCDSDIDNDGVLNDADVCDFTPDGAPIQPNGGLLADLDGDCDVALDDYRIMQAEFTGAVR